MKRIIKLFKSLSDSNRLRIIKMLEVRPMCVCEITEVLGLANSTVSKHLSILKDVGFIEDVKEGKWVTYRIAVGSGELYVEEMGELLKRWLADDKQIKIDIEKAKKSNRELLCGI